MEFTDRLAISQRAFVLSDFCSWLGLDNPIIVCVEGPRCTHFDCAHLQTRCRNVGTGRTSSSEGGKRSPQERNGRPKSGPERQSEGGSDEASTGG